MVCFPVSCKFSGVYIYIYIQIYTWFYICMHTYHNNFSQLSKKITTHPDIARPRQSSQLWKKSHYSLVGKGCLGCVPRGVLESTLETVDVWPSTSQEDACRLLVKSTGGGEGTVGKASERGGGCGVAEKGSLFGFFDFVGDSTSSYCWRNPAPPGIYKTL